MSFEDDNNAYTHLKARLDAYFPIEQATWDALQEHCQSRQCSKGDLLYSIGKIPDSFAFIHTGLARVFRIDSEGQQYNKRFFREGEFPGCMAALLTHSPSELGVQILEAGTIIKMNFSGFRSLLASRPDLMQFQIHYLEANWLLEKDRRDTAMASEDATSRYVEFAKRYPDLLNRIPHYHIASHLGITPVQLSRIRKKLSEQSGC